MWEDAFIFTSQIALLRQYRHSFMVNYEGKKGLCMCAQLTEIWKRNKSDEKNVYFCFVSTELLSAKSFIHLAPGA